MEVVYRICLFIAGIINIIPSFLAFLPDKISASYGIEIPDSNLELLLRHRAVLFGIIGGLMIYSAIRKRNYNLALCIGLISMISFIILLKLMNGDVNPELVKVMWIDIMGIIILLMGFAQYRFFRQMEAKVN